jgi:hypothetical protein
LQSICNRCCMFCMLKHYFFFCSKEL